LAQANWHRGASTTQQQDELLPRVSRISWSTQLQAKNVVQRWRCFRYQPEL